MMALFKARPLLLSLAAAVACKGKGHLPPCPALLTMQLLGCHIQDILFEWKQRLAAERYHRQRLEPGRWVDQQQKCRVSKMASLW